MANATGMKSGLTGWVLAIVRALDARGLHGDTVLRSLDMDPALLQGGYGRYSQEQITQLWRKSIALTGDSDFGLSVAAQVRPATFHVVGYAMSCSATLARALHRFAFYCRLISDSAMATITETGDTTVLEFRFDTGGAPLIYQTVDTVLAGTLGYVRWIIGEQIQPVEVRLQHAQPRSDAAYRAFFQAPIIYGEAQDCIVFRRADLERPILAADEELASMLDGVANRYLEERMSDRIATRVRDLLIATLPHGQIAKAGVAARLNLTERTLLRRLKVEGTTFADVLNSVRQELALQYLQRPGMTIAEISYLLGFSDENTFSRAFKRWTGRRPGMMAQGRREVVLEGLAA